jgi:hypothetical protein
MIFSVFLHMPRKMFFLVKFHVFFMIFQIFLGIPNCVYLLFFITGYTHELKHRLPKIPVDSLWTGNYFLGSKI